VKWIGNRGKYELRKDKLTQARAKRGATETFGANKRG